jgi:hypothetical protein
MVALFLARVIVSGVAAGQGVMPLFIDLNRTHATNPLWPGHARFHLVYQVFTLLPVAAIEIGLLWWPGPALASRFYLAVLLTGTSLAGFWMAVVTRHLYGGTLHDPNGIQPVRISIGQSTAEIDLNVPLVAVGTALLVAAVLLFWRGN